MTTTSYHMHIDIRSALQWPKRRLQRMLVRQDGTYLTPDEVRDFLMDHLAQGHEALPMCQDCDNHDWKTGCKGHPKT